jgi:glutaredoxin
MFLKKIKNIQLKKYVILLFILLFTFFVSPVHAQAPKPVVHAVMFWMAGCPHCEDVIQNVLPPLVEQYGPQFDLFMIEVKSTKDVDNLYRVAASYKFTKEQTGVPFLIIGDQVLVGSGQVREQLPVLIDNNLSRGGLDWPANPILANLLPTPSPASSVTSSLPAATQALDTLTPETKSVPSAETRNNGFTLAAVVMEIGRAHV